MTAKKTTKKTVKKSEEKKPKATEPEETPAPVAPAADEGSEEEEDSSEEEEGEPKPLKADKNSVDILRGKLYVRTFSKEIHGADFEDIAKQFIGKPMYAKRAYSVVPSAQVIGIQVRYREKKDFDLPLDEQKPDSPVVDKVQKFTDKQAALSFNVAKNGSTVAVLRQ